MLEIKPEAEKRYDENAEMGKLSNETNLFDFTIPNTMGSQKSNYSRYNIQKSGLTTETTIKREKC